MLRLTPEEYALDHMNDSIRELKRERERMIKEVSRRRRLERVENRLGWCFPFNILFSTFYPYIDYSVFSDYLGVICNLIRYREKGSSIYMNALDGIESNVDIYRATRLMEILKLNGWSREDIDNIINYVYCDCMD